MFQNYNLIDYLTPYENVCLTKRKADPALLHSLGLAEDEIRRNVMKLSGGQQQRTALGRSLASDAPIILADEPTGNLDSETADDIIRVLKTSASHLEEELLCSLTVLVYHLCDLSTDTLDMHIHNVIVQQMPLIQKTLMENAQINRKEEHS